MYKTLRAPHVVQIEVSALCSNLCQHCYNFWRQETGPQASASLSIEQAERIMAQLIRHKVFHLVLTGGEPLLNKQVLFRILELAAENGITAAVNTTLVNLTDGDVGRLKELKVSVVLTSILGPTAAIHDRLAHQEGAFDRTVAGIHLLRQAGVPVSANMVISKKNKDFLKETAALAKSLGLKSFNATRAGCPGNCTDFSEFSLDLPEFRAYLEELHSFGKENGMLVDVLSSYPLCGIKEVGRYDMFSRRRCMAGVNTVTVSAGGDVRPCGHYDISYGNLLREELPEIWNRMGEWRDGRLLPAECRSCCALRWCGGGCRMEAKMRNGSVSALDPYASPQDGAYVSAQMRGLPAKAAPLPQTIRVNPRLRWRPEVFGATFFVGTRFACYLNAAGLELIESLPRGSDFPVSDILRAQEAGAEKFAAGLVARGIVIGAGTTR